MKFYFSGSAADGQGPPEDVLEHCNVMLKYDGKNKDDTAVRTDVRQLQRLERIEKGRRENQE